MRTEFFNTRQGHIRSAWNIEMMLRRGPLTDRKIAKYEKQGWYSAEFREARRERMNKKFKRAGNFIEVEGRLIYSPS